MRELGLLMFQKSVWIHPYDCKNEIDFVASFFDVGKYIHHIVTKNMTNDDLYEKDLICRKVNSHQFMLSPKRVTVSWICWKLCYCLGVFGG